MAGMDLTAADGILKDHYTNDRVENMVYQDNPLLAMMPKMEDFGGRSLPIPIVYGNPQGRSATFARAQARAAQTASKIEAFEITRVKDYSLATIDNETLEATKGNANAFLEAATVEIDGAINSLTRSLAIAQYRQGYGEIGVIGSISTNTITLATIEDVTNFEIGQELDLSTTVSGALRAYGTSTNGLIVTGVNRETGVLTFGAGNVTDAAAGIPTAAAGDFIFVRGDHTASTLTKLAGLQAWVPDSAPSSTSFFGVDRSVDSRLGGLRQDASAKPIEEGLYDGAALVGREGWKLTHFFMSFGKYAELEKSLGAKVQYIDMNVGEVGFRGLQINGPKGPIKVVPDQNCPSTRVFGLHMPVWKHYSLGKAVRVIDTDGLQMLRQASADGVECRYGYYANMGCRAPGANISLTVA